jgi:transposase-like protein
MANAPKHMTMDEMSSALSGQLVSISQAASITGYGQSTIRKWIRTGRIKAAGFPVSYRICLGDILNPTFTEPEYIKNLRKARVQDNKARRKAR